MIAQTVENHELLRPVAGIILAAGASTRMGLPKLLLSWRGEPIIRHVAQTALKSGLSPVVVVTGAYDSEIKAVLDDLLLQIIFNPDWKTGQGSSVGAGVKSLPLESNAAIFLLGDQPQIPTELVIALVDAYEKTGAPVVAPLIGGKRGNPVLLDRKVFPDLLKLKGDAGARQVIGNFPPHFVIVENPDLLLDIDTPEDYQRLVEKP